MKLLKQFDKDVVVNIILYVANKMGGKVGMHKLFKTLYFADREHLSKYGRRITGDIYIAMNYGPVPSKIDDILKAVRGDSFFADRGEEFKEYFMFYNRYSIETKKQCNMDYLSDTDIECLDNAIEAYGGMRFDELTKISHDFAWSNTKRDREMSFGDMMREIDEDEDYAEYIQQQIKLEKLYC